MMVPTVARTTEEMLLLVPQAVREAAFGLGIPQWRTTISITLATARAGIITGIMLAFARVAGRNGAVDVHRLGKPVLEIQRQPADRRLPLQIYTYALSPTMTGTVWHGQDR